MGFDGFEVGCRVGRPVGLRVGCPDGRLVGCLVGRLLGLLVGCPVGLLVGCPVGAWQVEAPSDESVGYGLREHNWQSVPAGDEYVCAGHVVQAVSPVAPTQTWLSEVGNATWVSLNPSVLEPALQLRQALVEAVLYVAMPQIVHVVAPELNSVSVW